MTTTKTKTCNLLSLFPSQSSTMCTTSVDCFPRVTRRRQGRVIPRLFVVKNSKQPLLVEMFQTVAVRARPLLRLLKLLHRTLAKAKQAYWRAQKEPQTNPCRLVC
ncbi:hypothetical protein TGRH88_067810 [Toxoplasma gondii]|uniref:Uncharacterized protein n=1 Tax=Toxoplasma gondii TaxID=5811 RepID=A0A7J6K0M4_TOXGO|nr:hypothetical protein TGRH88_067810 [Toxoplasma gondii]